MFFFWGGGGGGVAGCTKKIKNTHHFSVKLSHNVSGKGEKGLFNIYAGFCTCFQKLDPVINCQLDKKWKDDKSYKRNKTKKTLDKIFNKQYKYISFKLNPVSIIIQEWHLWIVLVLLILQDLFDIILLKWCIICMENSRFVRREGPHFLSSLFGHLSPVVHVTFVSEDHLLYVRWCMLKWVIEKFSASSYSQIKLNSLTNVSNTQIMWDPGP